MKNKSEILDLIVKHGLALRQIPFEVVSIYSMGSYPVDYKPSTNEEIEIWKPDIDSFKSAYRSEEVSKNLYKKFYETYPNGRPFLKRTTFPKDGGYWMCQKCIGTGSTMQWNKEKNNLAPTLEESVLKYIESL